MSHRFHGMSFVKLAPAKSLPVCYFALLPASPNSLPFCSNQTASGSRSPGWSAAPSRSQMQSSPRSNCLSSATPLFVTVTALCSLALSSELTAQAQPACDLIYLPVAPFAGPSDTTLALLPLPNGELIAGGQFVYADQSSVQYLARWNGSQWLPFASAGGADQAVTCLARAPNGDIYAGGMFTFIGSVAANRIARYDGQQWHALGNGVDNTVRSLCVASNGDLVVGGDFVTGSGLQLGHVARWTGQNWTALASGVNSGFVTVSHLAEHGNGDLVIGGNFHFVDGLPAAGLARWNGTAWAACGTPLTAQVRGMATQSNGNVAVMLSHLGLQLMVWDGTSLQPQSVLSGSANCMAVAANGDLLVGGSVSTASFTGERLVRWDGATWAPVGLPGNPSIETIAIGSTGDVLIGGTSEPTTSNISQWNGSSWTSVGAVNTTPAVTSFQRMPNGDLIACGSFSQIEGVAANNIARFDGSIWHPMGTGLDGAGSRMTIAGGDLIVSGEFLHADGVPAARIARWDGSSWSAIGNGLLASPFALAGHPRGDVYASFLGAAGALAGTLLRWDGQLWRSLPTFGPGPGPGPLIYDLDVMLDGTLVAACQSQGLGGQGSVRTFDGSTWQFLGSPGGQAASDVMVVPDGSIYASTAPAGLTVWDGTSWSLLGGMSVSALTTQPNGQFVAAANFGAIGTGVARWTGGNWQMLAATSGGETSAIGIGGNGDLFLRGEFETVNELVANGYLRALAPCPAINTVFGSGCASSSGLVTLATNDRAWVGATIKLSTIGATANSLVVQVLGFSENTVPLPFGGAGCTLDVAPDFLELLLPYAGTANMVLQIPPVPSLVGTVLSAQGVVLEWNGSLSIQQSSSSNGLRFVVGMM
jgi:trimeric autotransporter adhesin